MHAAVKHDPRGEEPYRKLAAAVILSAMRALKSEDAEEAEIARSFFYDFRFVFWARVAHINEDLQYDAQQIVEGKKKPKNRIDRYGRVSKGHQVQPYWADPKKKDYKWHARMCSVCKNRRAANKQDTCIPCYAKARGSVAVAANT